MTGAVHLRRIAGWHRARAAADSRDLTRLARAARRAPAGVPFAEALTAAVDGGDQVAVIAEFKRRSPSAGLLAGDRDVSEVAACYQQGGAAALSVLTDRPHFGGCADDLRAAKTATGLPVLRKDFTVCAADVYDARLMGADAVLLVAAVLSDTELTHLADVAQELRMDVLVEAHDEAELERAVAAGTDLVGVNQRDLGTFTVDHTAAARLSQVLPAGVLAVAESGVRGPCDTRRLADAGYRAVLVGEHLLRAADPASAVAALRGCRI